MTKSRDGVAIAAGIALTGKTSASDAEASLNNGVVNLKWHVIHSEGKAKIWLATTNHFKTGERDNYQLVREVPVANGGTRIDVAQMPSDFYKIVIEMPYNFLNRRAIISR